MQFFEVVEARRSVRAFTQAPIERYKLETILTTARLAPSAGDLQAYRIAVIDEVDAKEALASAAFGQHFVAEAPVVLVFCASPESSARKYGQRGASLYCVQDAAIAACYAQLAATAQGLASCWVGAFDEAAAAAVLNAPRQLRPVALMPIGYAAEAPHRPQRRTLEELVHRGVGNQSGPQPTAKAVRNHIEPLAAASFQLPISLGFRLSRQRLVTQAASI